MNADVAFTPKIAPVQVTVAPPRPVHPATTESPIARVILIGLALIFMGVMLVLPLVSVFTEALADGIGHYFTAIADPRKRSVPPAIEPVPLYLSFGPLQNGAEALARSAAHY